MDPNTNLFPGDATDLDPTQLDHHASSGNTRRTTPACENHGLDVCSSSVSSGVAISNVHAQPLVPGESSMAPWGNSTTCHLGESTATVNTVELEPDYEMWAAAPALTPYQVACLLVGTVPVLPNDDRPPVFRGHTENDCIRRTQIFLRVLDPLRSHQLAGRFSDCGTRSAIAPNEAVDFLAALFAERGWGNYVIDHPFYQAVSAKVPEVARLRLENEQLRERIELLARAGAYRTPLLDIVTEVIAEFYASGGPKRFPKKLEVLAWLKERHPELTQNQRKAIYTVTQHPSRRAGRLAPKGR